MKIIDWERKGNLVRFYLGRDDLKDWFGDDWNDSPWEHNAGIVYDEFVLGVRDIVFPFNYNIFESNYWDSNHCKDDFKSGKIPFMCVADTKKADFVYSYSDAVERKDTVKFYMGEPMKLSGDGDIEVFKAL